MENIAKVAGAGKCGVLFDGFNRAIHFGEIIDEKDHVYIFEGFGQYPKRLVFECDSALDAQEIFEELIKVEERITCECL